MTSRTGRARSAARRLVPAWWLALALASPAFAQTDPGVRGGAINGQNGATPLKPLPLGSVTNDTTSGIQEFFQDGLNRFQDVEVVSSSTPGANVGLGPRFNLDACAGCHAQPTIGGTGLPTNPQFTAAQRGVVNGTTNTIPTFITANGPTREARFPFFFNSNGTVNTSAPNGGVEDVFTVAGRQDAGVCAIHQPNFAAAQQANNIIFRIPTPLFGAGLLENVDDSTLISNQQSQVGNGLGISGTFNRNGNDGTISRFGWKAQNKSLAIFSGEAYNVEMGISNEMFPQDRPTPEEELQGQGLPNSCLNLGMHGYPEDTTNFSPGSPVADSFANNAQIPSDVTQFALFMRLLAPAIPSPNTPGGATAVQSGQNLFGQIGCGICHMPTVGVTQASNFTSSLDGQPVNAYSDLEIHHMGTGLADNVSQGTAGGDQFRTAPLWGLGQPHAVTTFSHVVRPPRQRGMTWSNVRSGVGSRSPQYWQWKASRRNTLNRVNAGRRADGM